MKIVFIGGRDVHKLGGIENYMYNLATQLVKKGHEPIVFCESDHNGAEMVNGFRVIHMKSPKSPLICKPWVGFKATLSVIRKMKNVDIIHYNAWPPSLSSPLARLCGINTVMQGHGLGWQRSKYSHKAQKIARFMEMVATRINPHQIMCSADQTRYFMEVYNKNAPTIPTAINLPCKAGDSDILQQYGLEPHKFFLFLARLVQDKNPDYLIKAFKKANVKDYKLVIAGDNPADKDYVNKLNGLAGSGKNIIFTGAIYGDDKIALLQNAFAFCIPSTIEGLSISLLEAMSYKLPIIASDIAANREVLEEDKGFWTPPEDVDKLAAAIRKCITQENGHREMTEYNYKIVSDNYTWDKVADKYINYLYGILK